MRHGRRFSRANYLQNTHMCLLFVPKVEKIAVKWLFEVPHVCSVDTYGAFLAYLVTFAADIYLSHCVPHLPCMSL